MQKFKYIKLKGGDRLSRLSTNQIGKHVGVLSGAKAAACHADRKRCVVGSGNTQLALLPLADDPAQEAQRGQRPREREENHLHCAVRGLRSATWLG